MKKIIQTLTLLPLIALCCACQEKQSTPEASTQETPIQQALAYTNGFTPAFDPTSTEFPSQITFPDKNIPNGIHWEKSTLCPDTSRFVWSDHSLRWDFTQGSSITIDRPIPWMETKAARSKFKFAQPTQNCFTVWIYNETPRPNATLRFSFGNGAEEVCHFPFALNFSGWRTAWVSFDRDMQGDPKAPMDYIKIEAPADIPEGTLWIGDTLAHHFIDHRHRHGDYQTPFVRGSDKLTSGHWDPIMHWYDLGQKQPPAPALTEEHKAAFAKLRSLTSSGTPRALTDAKVNQIEKQFANYHITKTSDGIRGDHIYLIHHLAGAPDESLRRNSHALKDYTGFMKSVGQAYNQILPSDRETTGGKRIAEIFCLLTEHMLDQGFEAGSSVGTMHHFGYAARSWVPAIQSMQAPLEEAGLLARAREALAWFYNTSQMYAPTPDHANMDYMNTLSKSDFTIQTLGSDNAEKAARLSRYSTWISDSLSAPSPAGKGGIKPDGSLFHHEMHYHGYGLPALRVTTENIVGPLDGTPFEITPAAYDRLKVAYLAASHWCYPTSGFNACGRHPLTNSISQLQKSFLILAKSKPGTDSVDPELVAAYLRVFGGNSQNLFGTDIPEEAPDFALAMNYNASLSYSHGDTTVHIKGHGDGIRSHETYGKDNRYGRYLSFGTTQIFKNTTDHNSGHEENGWDWSRPPGATTLHLPLDILEGTTGFYGWQPKQRTSPSGATTLGTGYAAFLFRLDATPDAQSMRMRKSIFALGDTLVCLGSGIKCSSDQYPAVTTLFQTAIPNDNDLSAKGDNWHIDPYGTGYYIPNAQDLNHTAGEQLSRHNKTKVETKGIFSTAWLNHGTQPDNATYHYQIKLNTSAEQMTTWEAQQADTPFIIIEQQDDNAHVITCPSQQIEATTAFAPYKAKSDDTLLRSTDRTCVVIIKKESDQDLHLSIADINVPDLGNKPATATTVITTQGNWNVQNADDIETTHNENQTTLSIPTHRSLPRELKLTRI